jgi:cell division initiation protein
MFDPALSRKPTRADMESDRKPLLEAESRQAATAPEQMLGLAPAGRRLEEFRGKDMNISPIDLRQQRFRTALSGFDKVEVASLLAAVADDYEQALREADRLRQDLSRMEAALSEHREHERNLRNTLLTAQRLADELKENAEQEAKRIIREAEVRADLLVEKAQLRLDDIQRDIDGLRLKRREVETSLESTIQTLRSTLDYVRDRDGRDAEDKILLHRPRQAGDTSTSEETAPRGPERRVVQNI